MLRCLVDDPLRAPLTLPPRARAPPPPPAPPRPPCGSCSAGGGSRGRRAQRSPGARRVRTQAAARPAAAKPARLLDLLQRAVARFGHEHVDDCEDVHQPGMEEAARETSSRSRLAQLTRRTEDGEEDDDAEGDEGPADARLLLPPLLVAHGDWINQRDNVICQPVDGGGHARPLAAAAEREDLAGGAQVNARTRNDKNLKDAKPHLGDHHPREGTAAEREEDDEQEDTRDHDPPALREREPNQRVSVAEHEIYYEQRERAVLVTPPTRRGVAASARPQIWPARPTKSSRRRGKVLTIHRLTTEKPQLAVAGQRMGHAWGALKALNSLGHAHGEARQRGVLLARNLEDGSGVADEIARRKRMSDQGGATRLPPHPSLTHYMIALMPSRADMHARPHAQISAPR